MTRRICPRWLRWSLRWRGLRLAGRPGLCRVMFDDEELARRSQVGGFIHRVIGTLAAVTQAPSPADIKRATDEVLSAFRPIEARAHRQNTAGATLMYFRHLLPPEEWSFVGAEFQLGSGRLDLLWRNDSDGRVLADELKTGHQRQVGLSRTRDQVDGYCRTGAAIWGDRFAGVRVLSTTNPRASVLATQPSRYLPLFDTPFTRSI